MTKTGVQISIIYTDEHLVELRANASNGVFSGQADVYADLGELAEFAGVLRGFPANGSDTREYEFGSFDDAYAGGGAGFRFYCVDAAGHAVAEVRLRTDPRRGVGASDETLLHIRIEAAAVDTFVGELERMSATVGQAAILEAAA